MFASHCLNLSRAKHIHVTRAHLSRQFSTRRSGGHGCATRVKHHSNDVPEWQLSTTHALIRKNQPEGGNATEGTLGGLLVALRVLPIPWKLEARPFCQHVRSRVVDAGAKYNSRLQRVRVVRVTKPVAVCRRRS